jgi:putative FmdB family regulatory protein
MAIYEYHCPTCDERFSRLRPMAEADDEAECSSGHASRRLISVVAGMSGSSSAVGERAVTSNGGGGGCCGGSCGCR